MRIVVSTDLETKASRSCDVVLQALTAGGQVASVLGVHRGLPARIDGRGEPELVSDLFESLGRERGLPATRTTNLPHALAIYRS